MKYFLILTTFLSLNSFAYTKAGIVFTVIGSSGRLGVVNTSPPPIQANTRSAPTSSYNGVTLQRTQAVGKSVQLNTPVATPKTLGYVRQGGAHEGADGQYCRVKGFKDKDGFIKPDYEVKCGTIDPAGVTASCSKDGQCSLSRAGN